MFLNAAKIDLKLTVHMCFKNDNHHFCGILKNLENRSMICRTEHSEKLGPGMPSIIRPWLLGVFSALWRQPQKDLTRPSFPK